MASVIRGAISFVLSNFTLSFLLIGLIVSGAALLRQPRLLPRRIIIEKLLSWYIFFSIGVASLYNAIMHMVFGRMAAAFIGWEDSPFQFEVGAASLGMAVIGFIAAFRSFDLKVGALVPFSIFMWGAAAGHVYQMRVAHNFAPGNSGVFFIMDLIVPLVGLALLASQRHDAPAA